MELRDRGIEWVGSVEVGNYGGISEIDMGDRYGRLTVESGDKVVEINLCGGVLSGLKIGNLG